MTVLVMVCVNGDHGEPTGHIVGVDVEEYELRSPYLYDWESPVYRRISTSRVRIGRRLFAYRGHRFWVGNWCWDGLWMEHAEASALVAYLLSRGWRIEAGPAEAPSWLAEALREEHAA